MSGFNSDVLDRLAVGVELVNAYADTDGRVPSAVFERHGYRPPANADERCRLMDLAGRLAGLLGAVAAGDHDTAVGRVNEWLDDLRATPFVETRDVGWSLHFHSPPASFADGWAAGIAAAVAISYGTLGPPPVGRCVAADCDRLFVDRGRNRQRRFCGLRCQNRAKSSEYRQRRRRS